jgi:4-hydroxy 2-oxovalerate aldolase
MNMMEAKESRARHWLSYRSELKVLDCTLRDGGLMNDHGFEDDIVQAIYQANADAGVDYMEMGYKADKKIFAPTDYGPWKFCDEEDVRRIVGENDTGLKLSVMADAGRTDYHNDVLPAEQSAFDMVRVATYIHQVPAAMDIAQDALDKGYEVTLNLMAVSTIQEWELDEALDIFAESGAQAIYLSDSFGSFYAEQVEYLMRKYLRLAVPRGKVVGMHAHNNQQLAFANTIEAIIQGANMLDGSMAGLGRGAGNCPLELLLGFLHNPKYHLRPVLKCIQDYIEPLRQELHWGFDIPYMITGVLNQHPRPAMRFNASEDRGNYVKFLDMMVEEE